MTDPCNNLKDLTALHGQISRDLAVVEGKLDALPSPDGDDGDDRRANLTRQRMELLGTLQEAFKLEMIVDLVKKETDTIQMRSSMAAPASPAMGDADTTPRGSSNITPRIAARLNPPAQYKTGQNFSTFCQRFQQYLTLGHVTDENLYLLFLNSVCDRTMRKLEAATEGLTDREKASANLFLPIFQKAINPASECRVLRAELRQLPQEMNENIEDYAHRIKELASQAYDKESASTEVRDEACLTAFMIGVADPTTRIKLMEAEVESFEAAIGVARKHERIRNTIGQNEQGLGNIGVFAVREPTGANDGQMFQHHTRLERTNHTDRSTPTTAGTGRRPNSSGAPVNYNNNYYRGQTGRQETRSCWACNQVGHLRRFCTSPQAPQVNGSFNQAPGRPEQRAQSNSGRQWDSQNPFSPNHSNSLNARGPLDTD